jgi:hypothetical protein
MPVMARKTTEKTAGGKEGDREKGDMILFPAGKEVSCPLFPYWILPSLGRDPVLQSAVESR